MSAITENITNGVKWTGLSSGINAIVKLVQVSVLAHILNPDAFGLIAIAYIFLTFGDIIVDMGLTTAILHFNIIKPRQYSSIFWINVVLGLCMAISIYASSDIIAKYYNNPEVRVIIRWLSANIFIISLSRLHKTFLQKEMNFKLMSQIEIAGAIVMCVSAIIFALKGLSVYSLVYSTLLSSLIVTLLFLKLTHKLNRQIKLYINLREIKEFYSIGIFQFLSAIVEFFSRETDTIFISSYFSIELLGYYTLCKQLVQRLYNVINPIIIKVAIPSLSVIQNNITQLCSIYYKMIKNASYINFYIYSALGVSSYMILYYLYGQNYTKFCWLLYIMSIYFAIQSIGCFAGVLNTVLGKTKIVFVWSIYRVIITLSICYITSSCRFGVYVFIMTIGIQLLNLYPSYRLTIHKFIPMKFTTYIGAMILPLLFGLISSTIIISSTNFIKNAWINGVIGLLTLSLLYFLFTYLINKNIVQRLKGILFKI